MGAQSRPGVQPSRTGGQGAGGGGEMSPGSDPGCGLRRARWAAAREPSAPPETQPRASFVLFSLCILLKKTCAVYQWLAFHDPRS